MARITDFTVNGDTHLLGKTYGNLSGNADSATNATSANNAKHADLAAAADSFTYNAMQNIFSRIYPVGSVYIAMNNIDPGSLCGCFMFCYFASSILRRLKHEESASCYIWCGYRNALLYHRLRQKTVYQTTPEDSHLLGGR